MTKYISMNPAEMKAEYAALQEQFASYKALGLKLNMARGKPSSKQLDLISDILSIMVDPAQCMDGNIDAYIRLRFVSYWVNSEGKIVARPSQMPEISISGDWVAGSDGTYYHRQPVKPGEMTGELLAEKISLEISEEGYYQVLEVFADAIQSRPERAAKDKWGVSIDDGAIVTGK